MKLTHKLEAEIKLLYDAFWKSMLNNDLKTFNSLLEENFRQIGTTEGEVFFNKDGVANFYSRRQGTRLGLCLAYNIVKAHDGTLRIEQITNERAKLILTLNKSLNENIFLPIHYHSDTPIGLRPAEQIRHA